MKSWQFGVLYVHELLILAIITDGAVSAWFCVLSLVVLIPTLVLTITERRR